MDSRTAFLLEEPLAQILPVAWLGPRVIIYVEDLLFLTFLLSRRGSLPSLFSLNRFGFFGDNWLFQMQGLIMTFRILVAKDSQVPNSADILLDPIEIFADKFVIVLFVI